MTFGFRFFGNILAQHQTFAKNKRKKEGENKRLWSTEYLLFIDLLIFNRNIS